MCVYCIYIYIYDPAFTDPPCSAKSEVMDQRNMGWRHQQAISTELRQHILTHHGTLVIEKSQIRLEGPQLFSSGGFQNDWTARSLCGACITGITAAKLQPLYRVLIAQDLNDVLVYSEVTHMYLSYLSYLSISVCCLSACLSIHPPTHRSSYLPTHPSIHPSITK